MYQIGPILMARGAKKLNRRRRSHVEAPIREPSGRPQRLTTRPEREREIKNTVIQARMRVFNIPLSVAQREESGYAIGRMALQLPLAQQQDILDAAKHFEKVYAAARKAELARAVRSASDYDRTGGHDDREGTDDDYVDECERAMATFEELRRMMWIADPLSVMVAEGVILEDKEMWNSAGSLWAGLNAVVRHLKSGRADV